MLCLFIVILTMVTTTCAAQTSEDYTTEDMKGPNHELFAQGVECYRSGKYQEALEIFLRITDLDEQSYASIWDRTKFDTIRQSYIYNWIFHCRLHTEPEATLAEMGNNGNTSVTCEFHPPIDRNLTYEIDTIEAYSYNFEKAIPHYLELVRQKFGQDTPEYAYFLYNCSDAFINNSSREIDYLQQALDIYTRTMGKDNIVRVHVLEKMGTLYSLANDDATAARLYEEALLPLEKTFGLQSRQYKEFLSKTINHYERDGNHKKAIQYLKWQYENGLFLSHWTKSDVLFELAEQIIEQGDCIDGKNAYQQAADFIISEMETAPTLNTPKIHSRSIKFLMDANRRELALKYIWEEIEADEVHNLINYEILVEELIKDKDYKRALNILNRWMNVIEDGRKSTTLYHDYAYLYRSLIDATTLQSYIFIKRNENSKALQAWQSCLDNINRQDLKLRKFEIWQPMIHKAFYGYVLLQHAKMLNIMGQKIEAAREIKESSTFQTEKLLKEMLTKGIQEREQYWASHQTTYEITIPKLVLLNNQKDAVETLYNISLFSKGLLLNMEQEVERLLYETGSTKELALLNQLQSDRRLLSDIEELNTRVPVTITVDSLKRRVRFQEKDLMRILDDDKKNVMEKDNVISRLQPDWRIVRQSLNQQEVAVEFLAVPFKTDSIVYVALTLRNDYESPHMTTLFLQHQIDRLSNRNSDDLDSIYKLVWLPLADEIQNAKRIYFSASSALHQIGIEHLPQMSEYECYRLSSTRELIRPHHHSANIEAVLYGGLQYELTKDELTNLARQQEPTNEDKYKQKPNLRSYRGALNGLPLLDGSRQEVDTIAKIIKAQHTANVITMMGKDGSESSFKQLSGQDKTLLHLSTHGFYVSPEERPHKSAAANASTDDSNSYGLLSEDQLLSNSGLFMAGADNCISGDGNLIDGNDGILTAKEISRLDLNGLELVVLSACETALGDVSNEGVYGLQRAFKKAGAQSLLMSLWKVDDEATSMLMTEFYKNWMEMSMTKYNALELAKQKIRSHKEKGWDDPTYWAAFILLDGYDQLPEPTMTNKGETYSQYQKDEDYLRYIKEKRAKARAELATSQFDTAISYYRVQDYNEAEKYFLKALENYTRLFNQDPNTYRPNLANTQYYIGVSYYHMLNYTQAEKYALMALENRTLLFKKDPSTYHTSIATTQLFLGYLYAELKDYTKTEEYYTKAIENYSQLYENNPQNNRYSLASSYNGLAYLYAKKKDFRNAIKTIDHAIALMPEEANYYDSKGEILLMKGDEQKALNLWQKVLELDPEFLKTHDSNLYKQLKEKGLTQDKTSSE